MPKPPGMSNEGYWEYYRNRMALHEHGARDTTSSNSRYTMRNRNNSINPPPKGQVNPSRTEVNINPLAAPREKIFDPPTVDKIIKKPKRIDNDPYGDSSDEDLPTPEVSEESSGTEDEGQGSNEVKGPVRKEPNNDSHENDDTSKPKAKKKLLF